MDNEQTRQSTTVSKSHSNVVKHTTEDSLTKLEHSQLKYNLQLLRNQAPERVSKAEAQHRLQRDQTLARWKKEEEGTMRSGPYKKASKVVHLSDLLVVDEQQGQLSVMQDHRGRDKLRGTASSVGEAHHQHLPSNHSRLQPAIASAVSRPSTVKRTIIAHRRKWIESLELSVRSLQQDRGTEEGHSLPNILASVGTIVPTNQEEEEEPSDASTPSQSGLLLAAIKELESLYAQIGEARRKEASDANASQHVNITTQKRNVVLIATGHVPTAREETHQGTDVADSKVTKKFAAKETRNSDHQQSESSKLLKVHKAKVAILRTILVPSVAKEASQRPNYSDPKTNLEMHSDKAEVPKGQRDGRANPSDDNSEGDEDPSHQEAQAIVEVFKGRCNFLPPLSQFGVGAHPLTVDIRTPKRHPQLLPIDVINSIVSNIGVSAQSALKVATSPVQGPPEVTAVAPSANPFTRDYVTNLITDDLDDRAHTLVEALRGAQQKLKEKQPLHFKARMRYVCGLREAMSGISSGRCLCVLMAPDVELASTGETDANIRALASLAHDGATTAKAGHTDRGCQDKEAIEAIALASLRKSVASMGLEGTVRTIIAACAIKRIPVIYCLSRMRMAYSIRQRHMHVSCVAIFSVNGAHAQYKALMAEAAACRAGYDEEACRRLAIQ